MVDIQLQKIAIDDLASRVREMLLQIFHGFGIYLYHFQVNVLTLKKILRQHTHSRADFQHIRTASFCRLKGGDNGFGNALIRQKMLSQCFFCSYFHMTCFFSLLKSKGRNTTRKQQFRCTFPVQ